MFVVYDKVENAVQKLGIISRQTSTENSMSDVGYEDSSQYRNKET